MTAAHNLIKTSQPKSPLVWLVTCHSNIYSITTDQIQQLLLLIFIMRVLRCTCSWIKPIHGQACEFLTNRRREIIHKEYENDLGNSTNNYIITCKINIWK